MAPRAATNSALVVANVFVALFVEGSKTRRIAAFPALAVIVAVAEPRLVRVFMLAVIGGTRSASAVDRPVGTAATETPFVFRLVFVFHETVADRIEASIWPRKSYLENFSTADTNHFGVVSIASRHNGRRLI